MSKKVKVFLIYFSALLICSKNFASEVVDRVVAVVNDDIITMQELESEFSIYANQIKSRNFAEYKEKQMLFQVRQELLNRLIDKKLTDQEIKHLGITVSNKEIDNAIERFKESRFYTDEMLRQGLAKEGMTWEAYKEHTKEQILRSKLVNYKVKSKIVITKEDVLKYYQDHNKEYKRETTYHLKNIMMQVPDSANKSEKLLVKKRMEQVIIKLKAGAIFEEMAKSFSESVTSSEGGELGYFKISELSQAIQNAIKKTKKGFCTPIIDTEYGYQIFLIKDIIEKSEDQLESISSEIEEKLYNEVVNKKFISWLEDLRKNSHIKIIK